MSWRFCVTCSTTGVTSSNNTTVTVGTNARNDDMAGELTLRGALRRGARRSSSTHEFSCATLGTRMRMTTPEHRATAPRLEGDAIDGARPTRHADLEWAASGAMALTGRP